MTYERSLKIDKDYIINHLKHMAERSEKDIKEYEKIGHDGLMRYEQGVKHGLELAVHWLELQED